MKNKLKYFFENHPHNVVYATSDETLFINQEDAEKHAQTLKDNVVEEYSRTSVKETPVIPAPNAEQTGESALQNAAKKPSPNELKAIKAKAVADYLALFGEAPDPKLSAAQIQELIKTKQLELDAENQGEDETDETDDTEKLEGEKQSEGEQSQEDNQEENQSE
jgi:hypothetical protein